MFIEMNPYEYTITVGNIVINNVHDNEAERFKNGEIIVAREVDDEWWFYGCYKNPNFALDVAQEVNGRCFAYEE